MSGVVGRWAGVFAWTGAFCLALMLLDGWLGGPRTHGGYIEVVQLADLPGELGPRMAPTYFPESLRWPPARLLYRRGAGAGGGRAWFLAIRARETAALTLWVGATEGPGVPAPPEIAGCLSAPPGPRCPAGWNTVARPLVEGFTLFVVTTLPPAEARLILEGMERGERPR